MQVKPVRLHTLFGILLIPRLIGGQLVTPPFGACNTSGLRHKIDFFMKTEHEQELDDIQAKIDQLNSGRPNWELIGVLTIVAALYAVVLYFIFRK